MPPDDAVHPVAQAFHWFEPGAASAELHRVLRPGGRVAAGGERPGFGPVQRATFHHHHPTTPDGVLDRFHSVSHRHELLLPYRVDCVWCERR